VILSERRRRRRIAKQIAVLDPRVEQEALDWIESVSEFDEDLSNPQFPSPRFDPRVHE
jgi:hypothetical protein